MPSIETTMETCIIIIDVHEMLIGIIIDKVKDVLDIKQEMIEASPNFGANVHTDYILGIGKINTTVKVLLNIEKILSEELTAAVKTPDKKTE